MTNSKRITIEQARRDYETRLTRRLNMMLGVAMIVAVALGVHEYCIAERRAAAAYLEGRYELSKADAWSAAANFRVVTENGVVRVKEFGK